MSEQISFLTSQHHSFDVGLASIYGIEGAILIHHFQHWIRFNKKLGKNFKEGKTWTYQTRKEIQAHFPYMKFGLIRRTIEKLIQKGVLITGNFNKSKIDKTLWYAFKDEKAFKVDDDLNNVYERQNCPSKGKIAPSKGKIDTPIPDTKKDTEKKEERERAKAPRSLSKKIDRALHIATTEEEHQKFLSEIGKEKTERAYQRLSEWKQNTPKSKWKLHDNLTIRKWVLKALDEEDQKLFKPSLSSAKSPQSDESIRITENKSWIRGVQTKMRGKTIERLVDYPDYIQFQNSDIPERRSDKILYKEIRFKELVKHELAKRELDKLWKK